MQIKKDIHNYFMANTFNNKLYLVINGMFDDNNIVNGRNLGLNFEIHSVSQFQKMNFINGIEIKENSKEGKIFRSFTRITNFIENKSTQDDRMMDNLKFIIMKMNRLKSIIE